MLYSRALTAGIAVTALLLLSSCYTARTLSQGSVPCRPSEMEIADEKASLGTPDTWTVVCHEKRYYCAARYGQYSAPAVNCVQVAD